MKKIICANPDEEIKISEITTDDILIAKDGSEVFAVISHSENGWGFFSKSGSSALNWDSLSALIANTTLKNLTLLKVE